MAVEFQGIQAVWKGWILVEVDMFLSSTFFLKPKTKAKSKHIQDLKGRKS